MQIAELEKLTKNDAHDKLPAIIILSILSSNYGFIGIRKPSELTRTQCRTVVI